MQVFLSFAKAASFNHRSLETNIVAGLCLLFLVAGTPLLQAQPYCTDFIGTAVHIPSLPYNGSNLSTCGAGNEIMADNVIICGSDNYYGGEDLVFIFTPAGTGMVTISLTTATSYVGMMLYDGCPTIFLGDPGYCSARYAQSKTSGTLTMNVALYEGVTYYLVVDNYPAPNCIPDFSLSIPSPPAPDPCDSIGTLECGIPVPVTLSGSGRWSFPGSKPNNSCNYNTPGQEKIFRFTPTTTGVHTIRPLEYSFCGIDFFYKEASAGCNNTGWTCISDTEGPFSFPTGVLTRGVEYYILLDAECLNTNTQSFRINCPIPNPCDEIDTLKCGIPTTAAISGNGRWFDGGCGLSSDGGREKLYRFTPLATGPHVLQVNSAVGVEIDYYYKAASDGCTPTGWTCIGDINLPGTYPVGTLTAGIEYFIRLDPVIEAAVEQNFQIICPPANPCEYITNLACATPTTVTITGSGIWNNATCLFSTPGAEKLYRFIPATTGLHQLQVTAASTTGYIDYQYKAASDGCSSTGWICIDDFNSAGTAMTGVLTAGVEYYILLDVEGTTSSTQTFHIVCPEPCTGITPLACGTATTATISGTGIWDTPGAYPGSSCGGSTPGLERVFSYTPTVSGMHTLQVTSASGQYIDYFYKAASDGCNYTGWTCIDDFATAGTTTFGPLTAGVQYNILLDGESTASGIQTFQILCPEPCSVITSLACATPTTVALSGAGVWDFSGTYPANSCGGSTPGKEKMYSFTPTVTGMHSLQVTTATGPFIDYFYKAASSGGCSNTGWTCIDDVATAGTTTFGPLTAGVEYFILLDGESTAPGTQAFQILCPEVCSAITTLACATPATANLSGAGVWDFSGTYPANSCGIGTPGQERMYSFTPSSTGVHALQVTSAQGNFIDYFYKTASGGCNNTGWTCIDDVVTAGTANIGTLTAGVEYYILLDGESTASATQTFQILCPTLDLACLAAPTSPADGALICAAGSAATLSWPGAAGAITYNVYFGTTPIPPFYTATSSTSILIGALAAGTYYWQVRPTYLGGTAGGCPVWSFTVNPEPVGNTFANPILVGSLPYSTTGNNLAVNCWTSNYSGPNSQASPDVFYRFTKTDCQSRVNISLCGSAFDTYLHVLDASGGWVASDDNSGACAPGVLSALQLNYLPAGTYYIVVEGLSAATGIYNLSVTASDISAPMILNCPDDQYVQACAAILPDYTGSLNTGDNCPGTVTVIQTPEPGAILNEAVTVTLMATDVAGNTATCIFTAARIDDVPPSFTCPDPPLTLNTDGAANCSVGIPDLVSMVSDEADNCTLRAVDPVTQSIPAGAYEGTSPGQLIPVTISVWDNAIPPNKTVCSIYFRVNDDDAPEITCPDAITVSCAGNVPVVNLADVTNSDNCSSSAISHDGDATSNMSCANRKTVTRTYRATDDSDNSTTCTQVITVYDSALPVFTFIPANVTVQCNSIPIAGTPTASDGCGGSVGITYNGQTVSNQNCADAYTLTRQWTATDACGNTKTATQRITVFDSQKPDFTFVPANVTVQCNSIPAAGNPAASDGCGGSVGIAYNGQTVSNQTCTDAYTLTRQWTATDACGNTKTATQRITVIDTQKPDFTNTPTNLTVQCDHVPVVATPTATDNCDAVVSITYNGQTQTNGACPNAYTLTRRWTASDNCNNTRSISQRITVVDNSKPLFTTFPANTTITCLETPPAVGSPTASDGCGSATVTYLGQSTTSGNCLSNYQIKRSWRATDACGNNTVSTQTIQVSDTGVPVFTSVPGPLTIECNQPLPPLVNPTASDACGGYVHITFLGNTPTGSGCAQNYTVTRTWRAEDLCGNTATTTQLITVLGNGSYQEEGAEIRAGETTRRTTYSRPTNLSLQPNPTRDKILLNLTDFAGEAVTISILSNLGQLVWERRIPTVEDLNLSVSLREAGAAAGIYTVSVYSASGITAARVVLVE